MKSSTIRNHTHPKPQYNCTHIIAWLLGRRLAEWNWYNWRYMFRPPVLENVAIVPLQYNAGDDPFEPDMFHAGGLLSTEPLNHYLRLRKRGTSSTFLVNAGYLLQRFALGNRIGYLTLKEVIELAQQETTPTHSTNPSPSTSIVSIEGTEE